MKIGIDASRYQINQPTGVEWYSYHLINNLIPILGRSHQNQFVFFSNENLNLNHENLIFNLQQKTIKRKKFWTQIALPKALKAEKIDLLFVPSHIPPLFYFGKVVSTIHDVAFKIPELKSSYSFKQRLLLNFATAWSALRSKKIIVPSQATANDLKKYYWWCGVKRKIQVVYHGKPDLTGQNNPLLLKWNQTETKMLKTKFKISEDYFLYIGRIELKKNLLEVIEAFEYFLSRENQANNPIKKQLILAGKDGFGAEEIKAKVLKSKFKNQIHFCGYISEDEKKFLLAHADIFIFPSKYEGFGLPILEAFSFGLPVITSANSSMPEIAGKGAYLVNPDAKEIFQGMRKINENQEYRNKLIEKSKEQLDKFDWQKTAEKTLDILLEQ